MEQAVELASVRKAFGDFVAVKGVDLTIENGSFVTLLGPSGCGKTTILRMVAGLETPTDGEIRVKGRRVNETPIHRRNLGLVFQNYALFPHKTIYDNVAFGLKYRNVDRERIRERVTRALEIVRLPGVEKRLPSQLSGGQQQRIALARALAPRPRLLLLDEPFSSLDVDLRERLAHDLRGILKSAGSTALFVTHDQMEAFALGDLIGVMNAGVLEQWADAYTLYHRPATRFVARFIGHGVFAPAHIVAGAPGPLVRTAVGVLDDATECPLPDAFPDGECDILLRADDIVHDDASPVKACIERKAFRGSEFLYTLRLDSGERVLAHVPSHHDHAVGEWIGIRAEVDHVVTFPRETAPMAQQTS